jgi:molybdopterin adenylyltransferase
VAPSEHQAASPAASAVRVAVLTVSDTRTLDTDEGGACVAQMASEAGFHIAARALVRDEPTAIRDHVLHWAGERTVGQGPGDVRSNGGGIGVILVTGGTGMAPRDTTIDTIEPLLQRRMDGFGELFRMLSFAEIGPAAMLSRATGGIVNGVPVFVMPGSPAAVRLALSRLVLPALGHLLGELQRAPHHRQPVSDHEHDRHR